MAIGLELDQVRPGHTSTRVQSEFFELRTGFRSDFFGKTQARA